MHTPISQEHARQNRRLEGEVARRPAPEHADARVDWSAWYLTDEEDMGASVEQAAITHVVASSLHGLMSERGVTNVLVSHDNFFAWVPREPLVRVSPDVYLLDDPPPPPFPKMWQTWLPGHKPPRWALEVVSDDWKKDYEQGPLKYAQLGVRELVIFDPDVPPGAERRGARVPLQIYRRDEGGAFARVYAGEGPARSEELDAFLAVKRDGGAPRLRLARDADGKDLWPTYEEAKQTAEDARRAAEDARRMAEDARCAAEDARCAAEDARRAAEDARRMAEDARRAAEERAEAEAEARGSAEDRVRTLEAEIARLRGGS